MPFAFQAWLAYLAPLAGAGIIALTGSKLSRGAAGIVACLAMLVAFIGAIGALLKWNGMSAADKAHPVTSTAWTWLNSGSFKVPFQIQIDPLSIWMLLVVTGVGFLIHVYSLGYMGDDPQQRRFMAYLNIFVFSMLTLVLAANLVFLLIGWGLVGMASYLLIGFWHDRPTAVAAAKKAFIVNAVGDVGIMLGIYLIFRETGALSFKDVFASLPHQVHQNSGMAFVICLLLAIGAFAKSAQLPLHTWLPDAMEGPTPVSALIHAATMVTAGVYMVARLHPIFDLSVDAQKMIFIVGGLTLLMAGFTALAQTDIKRIIAYSTMSQIGYMFVAVGIGAYNAALFHLATHALFKALLFLGAGVVIHALGDEQDVRKMGGLKKYMPKTYWLFVIASLALSGIIPFAGFWSKDEILGFALAAGDPYGWTAYTIYGLGVVGALLTGIYSFRLIYLVFHGEESPLVAAYGRGEIVHHGHATNEHGEAPATMFWPVAILGLGTVVAGFLAVPGAWNVPEKFLHQAHAAPIREALDKAQLSDSSSWGLAGLSVLVGLIGIFIARMVWGTRSWAGLRTRFPRLERVCQNAFGWDALYDNVLAKPAQGVATGIRATEENFVGPLLEEIEIATRDGARVMSASQTGFVRWYAVATVVGMLAIVVSFLLVGKVIPDMTILAGAGFNLSNSAFSLPTLLLIVPIAGALVSMSMLTRRAAAAASLLTFLVQGVLLVFGGLELHRFGQNVGSAYVPSCLQSAASKHSKLVLAQCSNWFGHWGIQYNVSLGWAAFWLVCLTTFVTGAACLFTFWADRERPAAMHGLFWIAAAALTGLFVARDLVLFYVFFELMLVPMLILVGVWGAEQRVRATLTMFIYTLFGSLPMLVGVVGVGYQANKALQIGTTAAQLHNPARYSLPAIAQMVSSGDLHLSTWILASFLLAFAVKAPLFPFHGWQPLAYRQAPAEVTAVLSGLISKAAYFGVLIVVLPLFPKQMHGGWGTALTWVALVTLVYGCLSAFRARDPRGVVAYSSLAQMGLILLGLSTYLGHGGAQGLGGAYLQTINHALVSAGLFLLIGIIEIRSGETQFARLGGLAKGRPRLLSIGLVLALITLAVPGASTFAGELLILAGAFRGSVSGPLVATIGAIAVVLAAMYALRLVAGTLMEPGDTDTDIAEEDRVHHRFGGDLGLTEMFIVLPVVALLVAISVWPHVLHRGMDQPPVAVRVPVDPVADMKLASSSTKDKG